MEPKPKIFQIVIPAVPKRKGFSIFDPMMLDEGYIKFQLEWEASPAPLHGPPDELILWRNILFQAGLIGEYPNGVGFGNVSLRGMGGFWISGTQTGHVQESNCLHYSWVDQYSIAKNWVHCLGPVKASSESLTHAALYEISPDIQAVVHTHHSGMWRRLLDKIPTSYPGVPYGTPDMAFEMRRLWDKTSLPSTKVMVMGGHEDGIISFGNSLSSAVEVLQPYFLPWGQIRMK